jgi:hypothetical protein
VSIDSSEDQTNLTRIGSTDPRASFSARPARPHFSPPIPQSGCFAHRRVPTGFPPKSGPKPTPSRPGSLEPFETHQFSFVHENYRLCRRRAHRSTAAAFLKGHRLRKRIARSAIRRCRRRRRRDPFKEAANMASALRCCGRGRGCDPFGNRSLPLGCDMLETLRGRCCSGHSGRPPPLPPPPSPPSRCCCCCCFRRRRCRPVTLQRTLEEALAAAAGSPPPPPPPPPPQ